MPMPCPAARGPVRTRPEARRRDRRRRILLAVSVGSLCLVFTSAALYKFLNFQSYRSTALSLLPSWLPGGVAQVGVAGVPVLELGIALFVVIPPWRLAGSSLALGLLCVFTGVIALQYADGLMGPRCGCNWDVLRILAPRRVELMLLRNGLLILAAIFIVAVEIRRPGVPAVAGPAGNRGDG